ncbi:hypothetical protein B6K86_07720 [Lachnospiraceae bacterium]|nr:hypothetical protein B6K86_07720 [Lachnospiraceae bacterium]
MRSLKQYGQFKRRMLALCLSVAVLAGNVPMVVMAGDTAAVRPLTVMVSDQETGRRLQGAKVTLEVTVYDRRTTATSSDATASDASPSDATASDASSSDATTSDTSPADAHGSGSCTSSSDAVAGGSHASFCHEAGEDGSAHLPDGTIFNDMGRVLLNTWTHWTEALGIKQEPRESFDLEENAAEPGTMVYSSRFSETARDGAAIFRDETLNSYLKEGYLMVLKGEVEQDSYYYGHIKERILDGKESRIAVYLKKAPPIEQGSDYLLEEGNLPYNQEEQHPIRLVLRGENLKAQYADAKNPGRELPEIPGIRFGKQKLIITISRTDAKQKIVVNAVGSVVKARCNLRFEPSDPVNLAYQTGGVHFQRQALCDGDPEVTVRYKLQRKNESGWGMPAFSRVGTVDEEGRVSIYKAGSYRILALTGETEHYDSGQVFYDVQVYKENGSNLYAESRLETTYSEGLELAFPGFREEIWRVPYPKNRIVSQKRDNQTLTSEDPAVGILNDSKKTIAVNGSGVMEVETFANVAWTRDWERYRNVRGRFQLIVHPGVQDSFAFKEDLKYATESNAALMRYEIPYGAVDSRGRHCYLLETTGKKVDAAPLYHITAGDTVGQIQDDVLEFSDKGIGTIGLQADISGDYRYRATSANAEILVTMPKYHAENGAVPGITRVVGTPNAENWYKENVRVEAEQGYELSRDWSFAENSDWRSAFTVSEGNPENLDRLYIRNRSTGVISQAIPIPAFQIDTTAPANLNIRFRKPLREIVKELVTFGFYRARLEVTLSAEDSGSGIAQFVYVLDSDECATSREQTSGAVHVIGRTDPGFRRSGTEPNEYRASFFLDPQYRGRITFCAIDCAGNRTDSEAMDRVLVIDDERPKAELHFDLKDADVNRDGIYFQNQEGKQAELVIDEPNFFPEDEGLEVSLEKRQNGETQYKPLPFDRSGFSMRDRQHRVTIPFASEGHYRFRYAYRDPSGNEAVYKLKTGTPSAPEYLGNQSDQELEFTIDQTDPLIRLDYDQDKTNGRYFRNPVHAEVAVTEENFSTAEDRTQLHYDFTAPGESSGTRVRIDQTGFTETNPHRRSLLFSEDGTYRLSVHVKDLAGRRAEAEDHFVIDRTAPQVLVKLSNEGICNGKYFHTDRKGTVTIRDYNLDIRSLKAFVKATDQKGQPVKTMDYTNYLNNPANWVKQSDHEYTIPITFSADANYSFDLRVSDYAGNQNQAIDFGDTLAATEFTVDHGAPTGSVRIGEWNCSRDGSVWDRLLSIFTFGRWSQNKEVLRIHAEDSLSGVLRVSYLRSQKLLRQEDWKQEMGRDISSELVGGDWSGEIRPDDAFITYVHIVDRAGNESLLSSDGVVLDSTAPQVDTLIPGGKEINGLYSQDVIVSVAVSDPLINNASSGLRSVEYHVYNQGDETQKDTLYSFSKEEPALEELKRTYDDPDAVTINSEKNNSNDVVIKITGTDNAGNVVEREEKVAIDITPPVIEVSYDNNDVRHARYFNRNRTATVTVIERNFNPKDVILKLTSSNGVLPALSDWKKKEGTGNGDDTRWVATIPFTEDGDYTLDVAYTDLAGNAARGITFEKGSEAPSSFTIDKTRPVLTVSYDNNEVKNQNYYKENRIASIRLDEHNFSEELVVPVIEAETGNRPSLSAWSRSGDTNLATVPYVGDGTYALSVTAEDLAGNRAVPYEREEFRIDTTVPQLQITGVEDRSANRGEVIPVVEYSDLNLDASNVQIRLSGSNRGLIEAHGHAMNGAESGRFVFEDFPYQKRCDDIYALTAEIMDMAGNTASQNLCFSVNRFGSTYLLSRETKALCGSYRKEPIDLQIKEINVDPLTENCVTLFQNESARKLVDGADYTTVSGDNGGSWYERDYTVPSRNFEADGLYGLSIYSRDRAGNVSDNTQDVKDAAVRFAIDRTEPLLYLSNLETGGTYAADRMDAVVVADDNMQLQNLAVYVDGKECGVWGREAVSRTLKRDGAFTVTIPGTSTAPHVLVAIASDAAGNEKKIQASDFIVTTNPVVSFLRKRVLMGHSFGGLMFGIAALAFGINWNEKKKRLKKGMR